MIALVLLAGAVGAVIRYLVSRSVGTVAGVLAVNVLGSAIGGAVLALAEREYLSADLRLVLLTGFCGGLTTFSTWSVETVQLAMAGKWRTAVVSVAGNLVLGVGAAAIAYLALR